MMHGNSNIKNKGYVNPPRSDTVLKLNIREETAATLMDMTGPHQGDDTPQ